MANIVGKAVKFFTDPCIRFGYLGRLGLWNRMPDEEYLKKLFKLCMGYELDLENPKTFNEKLQWLKLYDRRPEYTTMVDKYAAKKWVAERIGEEYIIPTLGVWEHFDEIDFDELPDRFVLKCTHDSGGIVLVPDKSRLDKKAAKKKVEKSLKRNFYYSGREWPYKNVPPRIIAEPYLTDESGTELKDYKIFNFDGQAKLIQVDYDRFAEHKRNLYSTDWQYVEAAILYPTDPDHKIDKPKNLDKMLELAHRLSEGYPHIRTDFYNIDGKILFGELTLYHEAGLAAYTPPALGEQMGQWLKLPSGGGILKADGIVLYVRMEEKPTELPDYKLMCFNGEVRCSFVCSERHSGKGLKVTFYDNNWETMPFERHYPKSKKNIVKPQNYEKMVTLTEMLAKDLPFVRADFYEVQKKVYVGELTLYPGSGLEEFTPPEWDTIMGSWLTLPATRKT